MSVFRFCLMFVCLASIAGCASTVNEFEQADKPVAPAVADKIASAEVKSGQQAPAKDAEFLEPGSRVNDYVNESLPSQFAHTIYELNQVPKTAQYPTIEDVPAPDRRLLTLEERRKLEEELKTLAN